ncbi:MAG TPA: CPBP family intramembrane metalloprotease [Phycisphaerae bacterium]|mgnify:CR=1 FL=1|nr:CPBP family intramembrane metalloprotease [Phycisphaerae bacterium]HRW51991.1 CPBP family intramembrane metalloprotease [Phycisphaerae bacterium]
MEGDAPNTQRSENIEAGSPPVVYSARAPDGPVVYAARPIAPRSRDYPDVDMTRSAGAVDLIIAVGLFAVMFILPQVEDLMAYVAETFPTYGVLWSNVIIGLGSIGIVSGILIARRQGPASLGLARFNRATLLGTMAALPGCYIAMLGAGVLYAICYIVFAEAGAESIIADKQVLLDVLPDFSITTMLLFGVLTGIHEELLFRGLLLTRFNALTRNRAASVIACAVLFGMVHAYQGPMGMLQTSAIGLVLGTITTMTRSLWPAILGHAMFNSLQLALLPLVKPLLENAAHATSAPAM